MPPRTPFLQPYEYFDSRWNPLSTGLGVFVAHILIGFVSTVWLAFWFLGRAEGLPRQAYNAMWDIVPALFFGFVIAGLIAIAVVTLVMHYWSGGNKEGSLSHTLAVAGWSYAPNLLFIPVKIAWIRYDLRNFTMQGENPRVLQEELNRLNQEITGVVDLGIEVVVLTWSVIILAYGMAAIHDIDINDTWPPAVFIGIGALFLGLIL